ncbi:type VI immunity family protein [Acinetobacter rongchengensis]|uniref:DUF3396 domain-containing protein n=1 Tax=Acinetobacter rongchengensis TaxID=2419601 RepID=A0A3A8FAM4_9GAMM|nr:type VI immunity family protein [Acinetobacter rongchengensis]RKG37733.1 DUF3396 domain-containing protein [Acinetobacter rongchengensis]
MIQSEQDMKPYLNKFQWSEERKGKANLFIMGAEFQAHFLYFAGHTPEKRQALYECIKAYNELFGRHFTRCVFTNEKEQYRRPSINSKKMPTLEEFFAMKTQEYDQIEWYCESGERGEAPEYMIYAFTNRGWEGRLLYGSTLTFRVPNQLIFDVEQKQILMSLIQMCIDKLEVYHAVAGFQNTIPYDPRGVQKEVFEQAKRFLGIYQGADISECSKIQDGIKSIDWLTYLNKTLVQRICEVKAFPKYCEHFHLKPEQQENGFLFQLEDYPQLLPSHLPILDSYFNLNKALRPIRNGNSLCIALVDNEDYEILNRVQTRAWIRRFDAPDIFPDCGHYEERKPRKKNIYLESGRPCEIDGIYRYEDQLNSKGEPKHAGYDDRDDYQQNYVYDLRQQVVLLKGDIAPRFLEFYENAVLKEAKKIKWHLVSEIIKVDK